MIKINGKWKHTQDENEKCRKFHLGKKKSIISVEKMRQSKLGKHHTQKTKKIISNKLSKIKKSKEWCKQHSERMIGKENPSYIDGRSYLPYCHKFNNKFRKDIRIRDSHVCQLCGKTQEENKQKLDVHHIHYDKQNCYPDCITLCMKCNRVVNFNRNYYENLFMNMLNNRNLLFWTIYRNLEAIR